jgi:hypothetical protein
MSRPRFSIAGLLALVFFVAVAVAAIRAATELWDSVLYTALGALLLTSVLLALHRAEQKRAFWLGFAVFGWAYLAASMVPQVEARLLTSSALAYVDSKVATRPTYMWYRRFKLGNQPSRVSSVAFSPDGNALAATQSGVVWLLDALTGNERRQVRTPIAATLPLKSCPFKSLLHCSRLLAAQETTRLQFNALVLAEHVARSCRRRSILMNRRNLLRQSSREDGGFHREPRAEGQGHAGARRAVSAKLIEDEQDCG